MRSRNALSIGFVTLSFFLGIVAIFLIKRDIAFSDVWTPFWLHVISFLLIFVAFFSKKYTTHRLFHILHEREVFAFGIVFFFIMFVSFFQLTTFPYVSLGDELRDSGLFAQQIHNGQIQNIFGYGAYNGYGQIIPTIASFFYNFFASSVLTYRFPAALVSILDVAVFYILLRQITKPLISILGASILAVSPFHLFFARTQLVVAFNGLWASLILYATYMVFEDNSMVSFVLLGALLGFSSEFHATIRVLAILVFLLTVVFKIFFLIRRKIRLWPTVAGVGLLLASAVISFGPQMLFTTPQNFFHTERFSLQKNVEDRQALSIDQIKSLGSNYMQSLGAWVVSPVGGDFFHDDQPLTPILLVPLFLMGILYGVIFVRKAYLYLLTSLLFLLPFFTSAITDAINTDQRMNAGLPLVAIFSSIGIYAVMRLLHWKRLQYIFAGLVGVYLLFLAGNFFIKQTPNIGRDVKDYMSMNIIYTIQSLQDTSPTAQNYCLVLSKDMNKDLDYLHYKEQYQYFLPNVAIEKQIDPTYSDSEVHIYKDSCPSTPQLPVRATVKMCTGGLDYLCPIHYIGELRVYYN